MILITAGWAERFVFPDTILWWLFIVFIPLISFSFLINFLLKKYTNLHKFIRIIISVVGSFFVYFGSILFMVKIFSIL
jgi:hypothetical protein